MSAALVYLIQTRDVPARESAGERSPGVRTVEPVVRRPSRSRCASAARLREYFWPMTMRTFFARTAANSSRAAASSSLRVAM